MNNPTRKKLKLIIQQIESISEDLSIIREEEEERFDNLPEGLQESQKGQDMESNAEDLDDAGSHLFDAISSIQDAIDR